MAKKATSIIVNVCKHCHEVIDIVLDETSGAGFWEAMKVGEQVKEDIVTRVEPVIVRNSTYLGYMVELDTQKTPHCEAAERAVSK
jgi:hypothetical protein